MSIDLNSVRQIAKYVPGQRVRDLIMDLAAEIETLRRQRALENEDLVNAYDRGLAAGRVQEKEALARCMDCTPEEVTALIQQHAPWNGTAVCDDALRERAAVVEWLRAKAELAYDNTDAHHALWLAAESIESGDHRRGDEWP